MKFIQITALTLGAIASFVIVYYLGNINTLAMMGFVMIGVFCVYGCVCWIEKNVSPKEKD